MPATRVSICIPTRNRAPQLGAALTSVLEQDVDGLEVLVHDDASADDTADVVAAFADERIRYVRHPVQVGTAANRNSCVQAARGRYLAWLDSDDERRPGSLRRQLAVFDEHPEVVLVHGGRELIDIAGRRLPDWPAPFAGDTIEPSGDAFRNLSAANELTTSTVVIRRDLHDRVGYFRPRSGPAALTGRCG